MADLSKQNKGFTDSELREVCRIGPAEEQALRDVAQGRVSRGSFATVAAFKLLREIAHPATVKDSGLVGPVVIVIQGMVEQGKPEE